MPHQFNIMLPSLWPWGLAPTRNTSMSYIENIIVNRWFREEISLHHFSKLCLYCRGLFAWHTANAKTSRRQAIYATCLRRAATWATGLTTGDGRWVVRRRAIIYAWRCSPSPDGLAWRSRRWKRAYRHWKVYTLKSILRGGLEIHGSITRPSRQFNRRWPILRHQRRYDIDDMYRVGVYRSSVKSLDIWQTFIEPRYSIDM